MDDVEEDEDEAITDQTLLHFINFMTLCKCKTAKVDNFKLLASKRRPLFNVSSKVVRIFFGRSIRQNHVVII